MKNRIVTIAFAIFLAVLCLGGCGNTELEERNFPLAVAVTGTEENYQMAFGFEQLKDVADEKSEKENTSVLLAEGKDCMELFLHADGENPGEMDYNHLKALILSRSLLENEEQLGTFLGYLEEENLFSRNTLLFVTDDEPEQVMEMDAVLKEPVGTYLNERIASDERLKNSEAVTLGSLFRIWENENENLWIPCITCGEDKIILEEYYLMQGRTAAGKVDRETGELALLSEQKMKSYSISLGEAESVTLSNLCCSYAFTEQDDHVTEIVTIKADGQYQGNKELLQKTNRRNERAENRHTKSQDENALLEVEAEIEQTLEEKMDAMTEKLQQNQNADGTNSYYKLGGYARDIYLQYQKDWSGYRKNLTVEYYWDVTLVTSP
ncbi:Ger(x)C family spore germination protein [Thermoguttaceae bacterium LCP21S3_D4]|nr:Ger(x)C family spore germination C-terminal domain-containing protein [Lachnospiraceae bacterium]